MAKHVLYQLLSNQPYEGVVLNTEKEEIAVQLWHKQ
jgi:hypothetical protein